MEQFSCPRRLYEHGPWERTENLDKWIESRCSFCGSLKPEYVLNLMKDIEQECVLGPTDKNYKVYVRRKNMPQEKFYFMHFDEEQKLEFIKLHNTKPRTFSIGYPGYFYVTPYFCVKV